MRNYFCAIKGFIFFCRLKYSMLLPNIFPAVFGKQKSNARQSQ